jgi:uncharacterized protein YbbC (DUF1343 family)/CubicO group peptidase (beta-lactamase class C family)
MRRVGSRIGVAWLAAVGMLVAGGVRAGDGAAIPSDWAPLEAAVRAQIAAGKVPGAVVVVGDAERVWFQGAWGVRAVTSRHEPAGAPRGRRTSERAARSEPAGPPQARRHSNEPMTLDTVFDLASLTKVIVTTTAVLQLAEARRLDLDRPVAAYWPAFAQGGKQGITVRELLAHRSGLRAGVQAGGAGRAEVLRRVAADPPVDAPGLRTVYGDVNFIVLGEVVRRVSGVPLETYARRRILAPLGMRDSGFLPGVAVRSRTAPTAGQEGIPLRGVVHDPTARGMGGVAGHAGLFASAGDVVRFAQALLKRRTLLAPRSVEALQQAQAPEGTPGDPAPRGLGWELAAPLVANRDALFAAGAVGHTGYTGTGLWIDFAQGRFIVVLSNRTHPDGQGDARPLRRQVLALVSSLSPPRPGPAAAWRPPRSAVLSGLDVLHAQGHATLSGRRVGLITHLAAVDSQGWRAVDRLRWAPGVTLVNVFSPEHGLYGDAEGAVPSGIEPFSGLPLFSLYGASRRPEAAMLEGIDTIVFDVQDAGARFFTYVSTLAEAMQAAAERGLRVVVLDRPNPIRADRVSGPVLDEGRRSFTGPAQWPVQHGMTLGEAARWLQDDIRSRTGLEVDLRVVPMQGYRRDMRFEETGLDWVPPSPNLRTTATALLYPGVAWIEGANVSVGRGTAHPFEWVGAPWIDAHRWATSLRQAGLPGVDFSPTTFTPESGPYRGQPCHGVRIVVTDRGAFDAPLLGALLVRSLATGWPGTFDLAATRAIIGSDETLRLLREGADLEVIAASWQARLSVFLARRARYLLY